MPPQTKANTDRARAAVAKRTEAAAAAGNGEVAKREPATLEQKIQAMESEFARAMPRGAEAAQLVRDGLTALRKVRDLAKCEHTSILGGLMVCAQLGLRPGPMELVHLIPFWDSRHRVFKATVIIDYKGYVQLAHRAGTNVIARSVHQGDEFDYAYGLDDKLVHKPGPGEPGEATHYYAVAKWGNGQYAFLVWTRAQIEAHRDRYSKAWAKDGQKSIWGTNFDDQARKTMVRQLRKWMPMSTELVSAMTVDGTVQENTAPDSLDLLPPTYDDPNVIDGEVASDTAEGPPAGQQPAGPQPAAEPPPPADRRKDERRMFAVLAKLGIGDDRRNDRLAIYTALAGRRVASTTDLTVEEVQAVADTLDGITRYEQEQQATEVGGLIVEGRKMRSDAPA